MIKRSARIVFLVIVLIGLTGVLSAAGKTTPARRTLSHRKHRASKIRPRTRSTRTVVATHVVKPGDTLYDIARANGMSVRELKGINHLRNNRLRIGAHLRLAISTRELAQSRSVLGRKTGARVPSTPSENSDADTMVAAPPAPPANMTMLSTATPTDATAAGAGETGEITLRSQLIQAGMDFLGVPYRWKGVSETRGVDCSGLVKTLFDRFHIELPHSAREQFKLGERVAKTELAVGDLVFFSTRGRIPTHVGIYIGDNQFLHAASRARQVIISNLSQSWYQKRFVGARRIEDLWKDDPKPMEAKGN